MARTQTVAAPAGRAPAGPDADRASDSGRGRRGGAAAAICGCYLAAAIVLTWRLWAHPSSATVAGNPADSAQFAWFARYGATAVAHGRLPALVTTAMNAPRGINMMWNTTVLLPGVLLTPVTMLAGPQATLTVLVTAGFAGSAASLLLVLRGHRVSLPAAALGGAVYGFSPALTHAAIGHYQLQFAVLPPLIADAIVRLCTGSQRPARLGGWLGLLVAGQLFTGEELLFEAALAAAVLVLVLALSRPRAVRAAVPAVTAGLAVAGAVTLALAGRALWVQFAGPLSQHGSPFAADTYKNPLTDFVTPTSYQFLHGSRVVAGGGQAEVVAYLGVPLLTVLAVATAVCWRRLPARACAVTALVLLLLSAGAHPVVSRGTAAAWMPLPWALLDRLPVAGDLLPSRLSIVADGAAAALLAFAIDAALGRLRRTTLPRLWSAAVVAAVTVAVVLPLVPRPLPAASAVPLPAGWRATLGALRLAPGATVLVVPVPTPALDDALRWQADGGEQISLAGGYFEGPDAAGEARIGAGHIRPLAAYLDYLWSGRGPDPAPTAAQVGLTVRWWRPRAVLAIAPPPRLLRYLEAIFGRPAVRSDSVVGWRWQYVTHE
jgi:hypothetical protein